MDIQACALRQWSPVIGHRTGLHTDMQAGTETGHWTGGRLQHTHMGLQSTQPFHSPRASDCSTHTAQPAGAHSIVQMCSTHTHACDIIMQGAGCSNKKILLRTACDCDLHTKLLIQNWCYTYMIQVVGISTQNSSFFSSAFENSP